MDLMPRSEGRGGTKKNHAPKRGYFRFVMPLDSGIPRANGLNCGTFTTRVSHRDKASVYFHLPTGRNLMCGNISNEKRFLWYHFTLPENVRCWCEANNWFPWNTRSSYHQGSSLRKSCVA